ncbi:MAG: FHA domain-containing protein [Kiritimatiellae bacterium]|nr:FHA domain-containing protein [Kiritimatiellia bacterium]
MKSGGFAFSKKVLEIRLEMNGRVLCEGTTRDLPPETTIGRAADCGWRIPPTDKTASNHHARLFTKRGKWYVEDTGSRNGMYCKGEKVSQWCLAAGDQVSIGDCVLVAERVEDKDRERAEYHRLEQLNGADAGRMVNLDRECSIIGSAPTCDVVCDDNLVSHRHAEVECRRDGSCWVKDLKSRNGTRVNRLPLKASERMLRDGDILSVAYVDFRFWDKNTAHVPSNIRLKVAVAVMTVLVCLTGWFFWSAAHPSADHLLKRSMRQAEHGHFAEALRLVGEARLARHHAPYELQIQELALSIRHWQQTAIAWDSIQNHMKNGKWVWAQQGFNKVSKWDWNTDTAIRHKQRADCVERLLNGYLDMRAALADSSSTAATLTALRDAWGKALADAEREPAMQASVWPIAFEAETGSGENVQVFAKDTAYTDVWHPLREAGNAIAGEITAGIAAEKKVRQSLSRLADKDILAAPAQTARAELQTLHEADQRHKEERIAEQQERGYRVLRFCSLVENEYNRVWLALDDLVAAEYVVVSNLETIAAMEPDWENRLQPQLSFPNHTDEILFRDYQSALETANAALCGRKQGELKKIHMAAFLRMGLADPSGTPTAVERLTRAGTVRDAMRFIEWRTPPPLRWSGETPIPGCVYDEILGCVYVHEFLTSGEDAQDFLARSPGELEEGHMFCPVARQVREDYAKLQAFVDFVNAEPLFKAAATRLTPLPGQRPNRLKQYYDRAMTLLRQRDRWLEDAVEPFCGEDKGRNRDVVLARTLWLIVSPTWNEKMHTDANAIRGELARSYIRAAQDESDGLVAYLENCVPDRNYFFEWREYAASHAPQGDEP